MPSRPARTTRRSSPQIANIYDNQTRADRFIIGSSAEYKPIDWFSNRFRVGLDVNVGRATLYFRTAARGTQSIQRPRSASSSTTPRASSLKGVRCRTTSRWITTGTVTQNVSSKLVSNASFGMQYPLQHLPRTDAIGQDLGSVGMRSVSSAAVTTSAESDTAQKSLGLYVQEQLAWRDRLFAHRGRPHRQQLGVRLRAQSRVLSEASLSYVISEEPFFRFRMFDELRLRAAWGQAGNAPGPFDAIRSYTTSVATSATGTASALRYGSFGNPNLKPERGSEIELGFDSKLLNGRAGLDITYYSKTTHDALLPVAVPPSTGFAGTRLENLGTISNKGFEVLLTLVPIDFKQLNVETTLALSTNDNELVSFGDDRAPIIFGTYAPTQRYQVGFPLGAMWAQRVQYNPDGTLLKVAGRPVLQAESIYMGPSVPTKEVSFSTGIRFFEKFRFFGLADYKGGYYQFNVKDWRRDRALVSWETANPAADPDEVLARSFASQTWYHVQKADFVKLRDLSLSYDLPAQLLGAVADRATITVAGHNLKIWTKYGGADPELNFGGGTSTFNHNDSWTVPMTRRYSASLAVSF